MTFWSRLQSHSLLIQETSSLPVFQEAEEWELLTHFYHFITQDL